MGNSEKVIVLLILLVCAVVLGISLRPTADLPVSDGGEGTAVRDVKAAGVLPPRLAEPVLVSPGIQLEASQPADLLLSSLVRDAGEREVVLVRAEGLSETLHPDYFLYTCRSGDTWMGLAEHYYGSGGRADLLREANEGVDALAAGHELLVPAYDLVLEGLDRERTEPREEPQFRVYEVQSGDSLISISKAIYGTSARWMQIFDANRDVLDDPDSLSVGTTIRIP